MRTNRSNLIACAVFTIVMAVGVGLRSYARGETRSKSRIVLLMVWDGLRPDLVNEQDTPNLYALENRGVRFEHHHSIFPTVTMVNAAGLATGGDAGTSGILGDVMYFAPVLDSNKIASIPGLAPALDEPIDIENSQILAALDGPGAFNGHLLGLEAIGSQVQSAGGYVAVIGKRGPTFLFDGQAAPGASGSAGNYLFVADDMAAPSAAAAALASAPAIDRKDPSSVGARDAWFAQLVTDRALPAAKQAAADGHPAFVVFWQHNPDLIQHVAGLGTAPAIDALHQCDANLGRIESALSALGIADETDLMVVSDHGFATIRLEVSLGDLLVAAGIKKSAKSTDVVVAPNGGYDLVYLSRQSFAS
ncbi:MAG TPA: alkaline phosphatase family protein, partial [Candidatus Binataceae bacterium]|nr:alkaline phosphatase family protein [Candidatus Binataceae bacterium]